MLREILLAPQSKTNDTGRHNRQACLAFLCDGVDGASAGVDGIRLVKQDFKSPSLKAKKHFVKGLTFRLSAIRFLFKLEVTVSSNLNTTNSRFSHTQHKITTCL